MHVLAKVKVQKKTTKSYNQLKTSIKITIGNTTKVPPSKVVFINDFILFTCNTLKFYMKFN